MARTDAQRLAYRNYYKRNRLTILARQMRAYDANRAKIGAKARQKYKSIPPEERGKRTKVWYATYRGTVKGFSQRMLANAKTNSKKRKMELPSITREWIIDEINKGCSLTGLPLVVDGPPHHSRAPSLDRMDNSRPYTPDNTRVVCWAINMGLGTWGTDEYARVATAFLEHSGTSTTKV